MTEIISCLSLAGPYPKLIPMQPSPRAETSRLLFPSLRFCIVSPYHLGCSSESIAASSARQKQRTIQLRIIRKVSMQIVYLSNESLEGKPDPVESRVRGIDSGRAEIPLLQSRRRGRMRERKFREGALTRPLPIRRCPP